MTQVSFISRDELAQKMKDRKEGKPEFVVVDVRDEDFVGGNIKGAIHEPSRDFSMNVDELVKQTKEVPLVIFHCALSQIRGPSAARRYAETRMNTLDSEREDIDYKVAVLSGGFEEFQAGYKHDPELIENWDKDRWE